MPIKQLKSLLAICLNFILLLIVSSAYAKSGGAIDGGGGNQLVLQGCPVLLDLYLANPHFDEHNCIPGIQLADTKSLRLINLDKLNSNDSIIIKQAMNSLELWQKSSPVTVGLIKEAIIGAPLYYTNYQIAVKDKHYSIPKEFENQINSQDLKTIAFYSRDFGVLISMNDFNRLSKKSQIALIIHESLRHVQIQYDFKMSNASIQKIAAAVATRGPAKNESLDMEEYADGDLLEKIEIQKKNEREIKELKARICKTLLPSRSQASAYQEQLLNEMCQITTKMSLSDFQLKLQNILHTFENLISEDSFWTILNASSEVTTLSVGQVLSNSDSSLNGLTDVTVIARHSLGVDLAIDQANRGVSWLTGPKRNIDHALKQLVNSGFLEK